MKKLKLSGLDKYIIFSFTCVIVYIVVNIIITVYSDHEMDTLTGCVFAFFGGEVLSCAMIKRFKLKEENNYSLEDGGVEDNDE
jgi:preprotein translocase subunit SecY